MATHIKLIGRRSLEPLLAFGMALPQGSQESMEWTMAMLIIAMVIAVMVIKALGTRITIHGPDGPLMPPSRQQLNRRTLDGANLAQTSTQFARARARAKAMAILVEIPMETSMAKEMQVAPITIGKGGRLLGQEARRVEASPAMILK